MFSNGDCSERCGHLALAFLEFYDDRFQIFSTRNKLLRDHGCALSSWWLVEFEIQLTWYFLSEHGSETRHGKDQSLARSSEVRVYLWSECSGVVTDTLTLFRWLLMVGCVKNSLVSVAFCWFDSTSVRNSGPACFITFLQISIWFIGRYKTLNCRWKMFHLDRIEEIIADAMFMNT